MSTNYLKVLLARISRYAGVIAALIKQAWGSPHTYRPSDHYMRGPGPKWREKHGQDRTTSKLVQQPMILGDKWDF
jgi:hypothetical protein